MRPTVTLRRRHGPRRAPPTRARLAVELLEARNLLDGGLANVLVNDPTADYPWWTTTTQELALADTQSETALTLAGNRVIVAYNDSTHWRPAEYHPPTEELHGIGYAVSRDGGRTFQDMGSLPGDPIYSENNDPVLVDRHY